MIQRQFLRFLVVGGSATVVQYLLLVLLVEGGGLPATPSSAAAYASAAALNYWLNYHWTFASQRAHGQAAQRFAAVALIGLGLNSAIMFGLVDGLAWHYVLAQVVATITVLLWNFLAHRAWTFAPDDTSPP